MRDVRVEHSGRLGSPSCTSPASVSFEQLLRLRDERHGRYCAKYLRDMSDISVRDKSRCFREERGDLLFSLGLTKAEMEESFIFVTDFRLRDVTAGQLELVMAETDVTQSRPCNDRALMLESLGSSHISCCLLVLVNPSIKDEGWYFATTERRFGVTLCPERSHKTEGAMKRDIILFQDLQTILAEACWGVDSICNMGIMISSARVRGDPVLYKVKAPLTRLEDRQIVSRMEEILGKDGVGL